MKVIYSIILALILGILGTNSVQAQSFIWPVDGIVTHHYGDYFQGVQHKGIDIAAPVGTPIRAVEYGCVTYYGWDSTGYGWRLDVENPYNRHLYAHLLDYNVEPGSCVEQGDILGWVGLSGWTTGAHLHYEVMWSGWDFAPIDPLLALP